MENRREEIKGLKRLLVGVIVSTLLITMLPFESMGTFVAKAENVVTENMPESLSEHELFLDATPVSIKDVIDEETSEVTKTAEERLQEVLSTEDFATTYPNGVIIKNEANRDLDFNGMDLMIPAGIVGIELGGYSITNVASISFDLKTTSSSSEYGYNFFVLGDNANSTIAFVEGEAEKTIWQVEPNQQVVLYGVDVVNADVIAYTADENANGEECGEYGVVLGYDGLYLELPAYYEANWEQQYAIYREEKGIFRYNKEKDILYIDRLYEGIIVGENALLDDGSFDLCLLNIVTGEMSWNEMNWANKQVYSKSAMEQLASITGDASLCYYGGTLIQNPKIELYTEWDGHGVYTVTDEKDADSDKHVMTIYDYRGDEYSYGTEESTDDEITAYLDISENFFEGQSSQVEGVYDKVVFVDSAIPTTHYEWIDEENYVEYPITNIRLSDNMFRQAPEFVFDFTSNTEKIVIYNYSDSNIVVQDNTEQNEIWTDWNVWENTEDESLLNVENAQISDIETTEYDYNQFAKVGSTFTVTPEEGYTLYNIHLGNCSYWSGEDGDEYYYESGSNLVTSDYVKLNTNGTLEVTIPGQKAAFYASTTEMEAYSLLEEESNNYAEIDSAPVTITTENETQVAWHSGEFSVIGYADTEFTELEDGSTYIKHIYEICDIATESDEGWLSAIEIKDECINKEQVYYVIDRSMQKDNEDGEEYPASSYGQITKLTYTYSMDLASPQINGVTATDGDGNTIELEGDWVSTDETPPDIAMVWLKGPVTFVVDSDETEGVEYRYNYGTWQSSNTIITDEESEGNWFEVRDAFDIATGRDEGSWYTNVGIDSTAPTIYYTDANYAPDGSEIADLLDSGDEGYKDYEGNLYLETNDYSASGVNTLTLQKLDNNVWVECNSELLQDENLMMDYVYFIRPTTKDVTYKLEITDNVGNTKTYDSFTLKGYAQDISVEVTNNTGVYNQELTVNVRITNTSTTNSVDNLTYVIRESDTVFTPVSGEIATLAPGASHDITLNIPVGKDAGEYLSTLDIQYTSTGNILENTIEKVYSHEVTATLEKAEGEGSVSVEDIYYGEEIAYTAESVTNGTDDVTLFFRNADDETTEFTTDIPTEVGTYEVKAVFAESKNYAETVTGITTFSITRMPATADMYEVEAPKTVEGWYGDEITITGLDGNLLSVTEEGTYTETITVSENYQFYIKTTSGAITEQVTLTDLKIDKDLPVIYADGEELVSGGTYNQTIYLSFEDASSGVTNFSIEGNTDCIVEAEDGGMYLLQDAQDQVYSITAIDAVGNSVTYSEFTIKAYTQNIEVTVTNNTVIYGATSEISIHIKNVSSTTLSDIEYRIEGGETDDVFSPLSDVVEVINPGETVTVDIPLTGNADAGVYSVNVEISYTEDGEIEATNIDKIYTQEFEVTIEKAEGTGTVAIEDYYYGEKGSLVVNSDTNETYTVYYKDAEDETAEFTETVPAATGKYIVRVVFDASTNYEEVIVEAEFNIDRLTPSKEMYEYGTVTNKTGWITEEIIITAQEGYTISATEAGIYTNQLVISESVESYTFYVKTETGAITEAVVLGAFQIDTTAPEVAEKEGIYAVEKWWQKFLEVITFGAYEADTTQVEIKAHDNESGIANISYYISTEAVALADIESVAKWTEGAELTVSKSDYEQFIVYAKVENEAGLVTYLSTDGIKLGATETPVEPETPEAPVEPDAPAETVVTLGEGKVSLEAGIAYKLEEGIWNVAGDPTDYKGGIVFYVEEDGEYEFTKK